MRFALLCSFILTIAVTAASTNAASPEGRWKGTWSSQTTQHSGPLRARVRKIDHDTYRAVFTGRFAGVIPFLYPAKLERAPGSCDCYTSSQRLPLLGTYRMSATVSSDRIYATFRGRKDAGVFDLRK
jgi:hypothetical protein